MSMSANSCGKLVMSKKFKGKKHEETHEEAIEIKIRNKNKPRTH